MAGHVQNLKPWPKGVSGNPGGRPKRDLASEIAQAVFEDNPEAIYQGMLRILKKGDEGVFKVLADRAYGKLKVQVEADFSQSIAEQLQAGRQRVLASLSEAELNQRIRQLERELGMRVVCTPGQESVGVGEALQVGWEPRPESRLNAKAVTSSGDYPLPR